MQIIIPMAGNSQRFKDYGFEKPKYLIEVFGKKLLQYSLESLPLKMCDKLIFVVLEEHQKKYGILHEIDIVLQNLKFDENKYDVVMLQEVTRGQTETCYAAMHKLNPEDSLIIYNIDTYFKIDYMNFMFTKCVDGDNVSYVDVNNCDGYILAVEKEGEQWSFAENDENGFVKKTAEKQRISNNALVGFYHFKKAKYFLSAALDQLKENKSVKNEFYVAPIYNYLIEVRGLKFKVEKVDEFVPLGTPEEVFEFVKSKRSQTKPREFNKIIKNESLQVLRKSSTKNGDKILKEYNWFKTIDKYFEELSIFTPRALKIETHEDETSMLMEFIPFKSVSEIFLYDKLSFEERKDCIDKLTNVLFDNLAITNSDLTPSDEIAVIGIERPCLDLYEKKTRERFGDIVYNNIIPINNLRKDFFINGVVYPYIMDYLSDIVNKFISLDIFKLSILHGDYCFPNILYDVKSTAVKLIDPRGLSEISLVKSIGDMYYDIAKMRHSLSGYDLIINDFYSLEIENSDDHNLVEINYNIFWNDNFNKKTLAYFDEVIQSYDIDMRVVKTIEALLFLTMIPLHYEDSKRQNMFYVLAVEKLNEAKQLLEI